MGKGRIEIVLVRLGAIAVAMSAIYTTDDFSSTFFDEGVSGATQIGMMVLIVLLPLSIAAFLWNFPRTVIGKVSPELQRLESGQVNADIAMSIGTALLGLYVFIFGLLDVFYTESYSAWERSLIEYYESTPYYSPASHTAGRIVSYAQVIIGVILIFGRRGIARLILNFRGRGREVDV